MKGGSGTGRPSPWCTVTGKPDPAPSTESHICGRIPSLGPKTPLASEPEKEKPGRSVNASGLRCQGTERRKQRPRGLHIRGICFHHHLCGSVMLPLTSSPTARHTHTHAHMHMCTHAHTQTHAHACTRAHTCTLMHTYMHTTHACTQNTCTHMYAGAHAHTHARTPPRFRLCIHQRRPRRSWTSTTSGTLTDGSPGSQAAPCQGAMWPRPGAGAEQGPDVS